MVAHVASTACHIGILRKTIRNDLFDRYASCQRRKHVAVVWEEEVFSWTKHLTQGQLYTVMTGKWCVVRPTLGHLEVVGGFLVKPAT